MLNLQTALKDESVSTGTIIIPDVASVITHGREIIGEMK